MSGHTPGPWRCLGTEVYFANVAGGFSLCNCPDAEANARLIAAAPEMLSDLCDVAATLRRYESLHRAKNTEESTAKAEVNAALAARFEATIAKAKGEA